MDPVNLAAAAFNGLMILLELAGAVVYQRTEYRPPAAADCRPVDPVTYEILSEECPTATTTGGHTP